MKWICSRTVCELHFRAVKWNDWCPPSVAAFIHIPIPSALLFLLNRHSLSPSLGGPGHHSVKLNHKSCWADETVRLRTNEWLGSVVWCLLMNGQGSEDSIRRSRKVQGLSDGLWACCYFSRKCDISKILNCQWLLHPFGENLGIFSSKSSPHFLILKCFNAEHFP